MEKTEDLSIGQLDPDRFSELIDVALKGEVSPGLLDRKPIGTLGTMFRIVQGNIDILDAAQSKMSALKKLISEALMNKMISAGLDKASAEGITFTVTPRDTYSVSDWDSVQRGLIAEGRGDILYKQLSASKLREAFEAGLRLPEGLELGKIKQLSYRRSGRKKK